MSVSRLVRETVCFFAGAARTESRTGQTCAILSVSPENPAGKEGDGLQRILNMIEESLDAELSPEELAERSGYSLWHFLHLFTQEVGMPLQRYRMRRRLTHAIWHISGGMRITDAALRWGFDTHSGFFRAFRREYGMSPTTYLRTHRIHAPSVPVLKEEVFKMLTREKFREALACWGAEYAALPLTPVTYPDAGQISESAMYAGEGYVFKAYRDEGACCLAAELAEALHAQGIPASRVIPLPDGRRALPFPEGFWLTLCHRIDGKPMRSRDMICTPEESGRCIGAALAGLHRATAAVDGADCVDDEPYADHLLNWALPNAKDFLPEGFPADYAGRLEQLRDLPVALVHRDPNPSNLIDCGDRVGFIDFDLSRRFVRIFDPCCTITAVLSEVFGRDELPWQENWPVFCKAVLAGYDSVSPLTDAEWAAVPTLLVGNEVLCLAAFAGSSKFREVFEVNRRMLTWMLAHMPV